MARYGILAAARSDLTEIRAYIMRSNPRRAVTFVRELTQCFEQLSATPLMGRARPDLRPGLCSTPHGSYLIFYTPRPTASRSCACCTAPATRGGCFEVPRDLPPDAGG